MARLFSSGTCGYEKVVSRMPSVFMYAHLDVRLGSACNGWAKFIHIRHVRVYPSQVGVR
jgi:hypothetical protein